MSNRERHRALKAYATDDAVIAAAGEAGATRRGVGIAAACMRSRMGLPLYVLLYANHHTKRLRSWVRIVTAKRVYG